VLLLGYICSIYRENLADPLDKIPNILKTIVRITDIITLFMSDNNFYIQKACSHSLNEMFDYCMPKDDYNAIVLIFFDPLISIILSGTNKVAQQTALICIGDLVKNLNTKKLTKPLELISSKIIGLITVKYILNFNRKTKQIHTTYLKCLYFY